MFIGQYHSLSSAELPQDKSPWEIQAVYQLVTIFLSKILANTNCQKIPVVSSHKPVPPGGNLFSHAALFLSVCTFLTASLLVAINPDSFNSAVSVLMPCWSQIG
jgi:hypothetical protein